jgi:hypothetical protein
MGEPLTLVLKYSHGVGELNADLTHPVAAAFRRGMEEGQLTGSWRFLVLKADPSPRLILGTFVRTRRDRILFFPGGTAIVSTDDPTAKFYARHLGHITLDPQRTQTSASHFASRGLPPKHSRGLEYRTTPPPGHMVPWFSLLLPDLEGLSVLPKTLSIISSALGGRG